MDNPYIKISILHIRNIKGEQGPNKVKSQAYELIKK
jgi:hypothetical protein